jgi:AraC-like DNA-binding protein
VNGIIWSVLIFIKKRKGSNIYLGIFVLLFSLSSVKIILQESIPYFNYYLPFPLLYQFAFGPLLYLYFKKSLTPVDRASNTFLYFIPSVLFDIVPAIIKFYIGPGHYEPQIEKILFLTDILAFFFFAFYVVLSWRLINNVDHKISTWLNKMLTASVLICLTWSLYIFLVLAGKGNWIYGTMPYYPIYIVFGLCIYSIGIAGYFRPELGLLEIPAAQRKILLSEKEVIAKQEYIMALLQQHNYYNDEGLTLAKLSKQLKIPKKELSYIINTGFNMNFNDFINEFRIKAFKERLKDPESNRYNFIGLAYEVGFNSKASFYRAFKKSTSQTPGEYYNASIK